MTSGRIDYYAYIKSDAWRERANAAKVWSLGRCQVCYAHESEKRLDAHHRTYERLGNELPQDITVLCEDCHKLYEDFKKGKRTAVSIQDNSDLPSWMKYSSSQSIVSSLPKPKPKTESDFMTKSKPDPVEIMTVLGAPSLEEITQQWQEIVVRAGKLNSNAPPLLNMGKIVQENGFIALQFDYRIFAEKAISCQIHYALRDAITELWGSNEQ